MAPHIEWYLLEDQSFLGAALSRLARGPPFVSKASMVEHLVLAIEILASHGGMYSSLHFPIAQRVARFD